ncbi:hypothetical protein F442_17082 [Phytophthora nicotianae P10297]|uniref:Uncharacterized protein n=1 Tax=Phytophthora nicotianae P10297 TaxID=1317064 RepID=W2YHR3_PHYNI|nr:hypothetical protein F442_17082 [Phytophthora nicotianae P10297]
MEGNIAVISPFDSSSSKHYRIQLRHAAILRCTRNYGASTEAMVITANSVQTKTSIFSLNAVNPNIEDRRFLRAHKSAVTAADEERGLPTAAGIKEKFFKLKMKIAMPDIKKVLENVVSGIFK